MFNELADINKKPKPFEFYTTEDLWTNEHTSKKMLELHLNESVDAASRNSNTINQSVSWIFNHFKLNPTSSIIDFGCGPGLYTNKFAARGVSVTGVDFSKRSIDYAQNAASEKGLKVKYILKNYIQFDTDEQYDLITMIMCDFSALSPTHRRIMLEKFKKLLKPNGRILLDVYSLAFFNKKQEFAAYEFNSMDNFWSPEDYYCFINTMKYDDIKVCLDKYTIIEKKQKRVVYNWFQCFSKDTIRKEFEENGLIIDEYYSDVSGQDYNSESLEFAVVAIK